MTSLLPTKFFLPPVPDGFVARPQLFEILHAALTRRLTLVSAPAGAGKTTLASAWAGSVRKQGAAIGWCSLDSSDNNPVRFREYLVACLEEGGSVLDPGVPPPRPGEHAQGRDVLDGLIRGLANQEREIVLILDDYHHIENSQVHAALDFLLDYAPQCLHLILLTRSDPPLQLARLRVAGQLTELRMEQLRFTVPEAAAFLGRAAGVRLTDADVRALNARTEGWIAGLQMAAISLRGRQDAPAFVAAFAGSHRFVSDYLLEQVLNRQAPPVREFLLRTSVLERLSAPLCDALADTAGAAQELLLCLERANLFLTPLDDERIWYRYHHLFADLLKLVLEQTRPGLAAELHRRACDWHASHGMFATALRHAFAAGDMALVARLVSTNVLALVEQAELAPILLRMEAVPHEQRASIPWLAVAHAWALAFSGQMERAGVALSLAERRLDPLPPDERDRIAGHIAAVRAYLAWVHGNRTEAVEQAETAAHLLPAEEIALRALNLTTLGNALTQYAADPAAVEVLERAVVLARPVEQPHVYMLAASALAYAHIRLGRLRRAHAVCQDAIEIAETHHLRAGRPLTAAACVYAELAAVLAEWGQTGPAVQAARKGLALSELWGQADTIAVCLLNLINALSLAHDAEAAAEALYRVRKLAHQVSPWFVLNADQLEVEFWLDQGDLAQAARAARQAAGPLPPWLEAHLLVKQNRFDQALSLLERTRSPEVEPLSRETMRIAVVRSLALFHQGDQGGALVALRLALELAQAENCVTLFLRQGEPMEKLLHLARARSIAPEFTGRLLTAFEAHRKPGPAPAAEPLLEPLSRRELEILALLNGPLSTPEIAGQLILSVNTVRTHIKSIYGKLGVHGRSGAVKRAQELGLLP